MTQYKYVTFCHYKGGKYDEVTLDYGKKKSHTGFYFEAFLFTEVTALKVIELPDYMNEKELQKWISSNTTNEMYAHEYWNISKD